MKKEVHIAFPGSMNDSGLKHPRHPGIRKPTNLEQMFTMKTVEDDIRRLLWGRVSEYNIHTAFDPKINPDTNKPYAYFLKDECDVLHGILNPNK